MSRSIIFTTIFFYSSMLFAQPSAVEIIGDCAGFFQGTYIQEGGAMYNGCPCYEKEDDNRILHMHPVGTQYGWTSSESSDGSCTGSIVLGRTLTIDNHMECDATLATPTDPCFSITETSIVIPTLSEWCVIILGLGLAIVATISINSLVAPSFQVG